MIDLLDVHTHLPRRADRTAAAAICAATLEGMTASGIGAAVVMPLDGLYAEPAGDNDLVLAVCAGSSGRLIPACTVDPHSADAVAELERCAGLGARALKLHPWLQGFDPIEPEAIEVARAAARLRLPLLVHDGTPPFSSPLQIGELAGRVPECTVVLAHGGLMDLWQDAIAAVLRWPNVMVTLCGTAGRAILRSVLDSVPADRVALGTDAGFGDPDLAVHRVRVARRLLDGLPPASAAAIAWDNAARWLGLQ